MARSGAPTAPPMPTHTTSAAGLKPPADWQRGRVRKLSTAGGPHAPERVRAWLQATTGWLPRDLESALLLLTCELVNNSVLHGHASEQDLIEIELRATASGLRAQVTDPGRGFSPMARGRDLDEPGGWGLVLVERMAKCWGVDSEDRTCVWFELAAA
jgi:anti-sigma regulatory factor (Ser/Thr protein kinase)